MNYFGQSNSMGQLPNSSLSGNNQFNFTPSNFVQQPLFPQPSGNVYNINNTLEVANVPSGMGLSVALCLPENTMYIKTMQNGNPMFWAYKVFPIGAETDKKLEGAPTQEDSSLTEELQRLNSRIETLEKQLATTKKTTGGQLNEWI